MHFKKNDNGFECINCNKKVYPLGYSSRNHCPHCLYSLHVDIMPGDRQNNCKGLLRPVGIEISGKKGYVIVHKCEKCNATLKNKSAKDDCYNAILEVSKNTV